jgi:hypothetical protein
MVRALFLMKRPAKEVLTLEACMACVVLVDTPYNTRDFRPIGARAERTFGGATRVVSAGRAIENCSRAKHVLLPKSSGARGSPAPSRLRRRMCSPSAPRVSQGIRSRVGEPPVPEDENG